MAFVCPPPNEAEKRIHLLSELKKVLDCVEDKLAVAADPTYCITPCLPFAPCNPCCSPCCSPCCPPCCPPCCLPCCPDEKQEEKCEPPDTLVCYKVPCKTKKSKKLKKDDSDSSVNRVKKSSSRELRASILYVGCDCEKRNGLQDDCHRSDCQGAPPCLTKPPTCGPSEYCDGKHLGKRYGKKEASSKGNGGGTNGDDSDDDVDANYVCFPAKINPPKMIVPTCYMTLDSCSPPCCPFENGLNGNNNGNNNNNKNNNCKFSFCLPCCPGNGNGNNNKC